MEESPATSFALTDGTGASPDTCFATAGCTGSAGAEEAGATGGSRGGTKVSFRADRGGDAEPAASAEDDGAAAASAEDDGPSDGAALFEQVVSAKYVTVFAADDPPCDGNGDDLAGDDVVCLQVRNLDTGEVCTLSEDSLGFEDKWASPTELAQGRRKVWDGWWDEKRRCDEQLWFTAETGDVHQLLAALNPEGGVPVEVNSRAIYGRSALHVAAGVGSAECVETLLRYRADVEARTDTGLRALHIACQHGHIEVTRVLVESWGCKIHAETEDRDTALHLAAATGHTEVVGFLLQRVGDRGLNARNRLGQRPAEVSMDIGTAELFQKRLRAEGEAAPEEGEDEDHYAGRTPFHEGSVLLHNARADAVQRLLHRTRFACDPEEPEGTEMQSTEAPGAARPHGLQGPKRGSVHKPFARLRSDSPGIERVGPDSFDFRSQLGKGSFGEVFQVAHKRTGHVYAMKVLLKNRIIGRNLLRYAMTERNVLSYIHHPYIVGLHWAFQTETHLVLVLQLCPGGNLQAAIAHEQRLQVPTARLYTSQLLLALEHLHERHIIFRDLKPENVVLDENRNAMLTDFGLSKEGVEGINGTRSFCGSVAYLAPEILRRRGHGHVVDIYGLGVLLFEMLTGLPPFYHRDRDKLFQNIEKARLRIPQYVPPTAASLIEELMDRDPALRLGAEHTSDVRKHAFFTGMDFAAVFRREVPVPRGCSSSNSKAAPLSRGVPASPFVAGDHRGWRRAASTSQSSESREVTGWEFATPTPTAPPPSWATKP